MHLLFLTFGNQLQNHIQGAFCMYSFLRQQRHIDSINIITDAPAFYNHLSSVVNILPVDAATINEWKGPHDYFWRVKIKAIQKLASRHPDDAILYLDTDTFLYTDIAPLKKTLQSGQALMHEDEGALSTATTKRAKLMWQAIRGKQFGGITMKPTDHMWNAGVIATPNTQQGKEFDMALEICDGICAAGVNNHTIEQYSMTLSLNHHYTLAPAESMIAHYWSNKEEWNQFIMAWLTEHHCKRTSYEAMVADFNQLDLTKVPIMKKRRSTAIKLHNWVDKQFAPRDVTYVHR